MNHCGTQTLETERLVLRRLTLEDADAVYRNWASDPEVTRFLTWPTHTSTEVSEAIIRTWLPLYEKDDYYHWAITLKENGDEPIGTIHGLVNEDLSSVQVGYCIGKAWWHQGSRPRRCRRSSTFSLTGSARKVSIPTMIPTIPIRAWS